MLDFEKIQAFLSVAKNRSVYKASDELYITQPTLSYRLNALEREIGGRLFVRNRGNAAVELTQLGENFMPIARRLEKDYFDALRLSALTPREELRISTVDSLNNIFVPFILEDLLSRPQNYSLTVDTDWYYDIYKKVQDFKLDLGFVTRFLYTDNVLALPLYEERMLLAHSASSARYAAVCGPEALDPNDEVFLSYGDNFNAWHQTWFGVVGSPNIISDKFELLGNLLSMKDFWAIVPSSVAQKLKANRNIVVKTMRDPPPNRITYLLRNETSTPFLAKHWTQVAELVSAYLERMKKQYQLIVPPASPEPPTARFPK